MLLCLAVHATAILWARQAFQTATVRAIRTTGMCSFCYLLIRLYASLSTVCLQKSTLSLRVELAIDGVKR